MFTQSFKACHHLMLNLSSNASQAEDATSSQKLKNNHHPDCPVDSKQKCEGSFKKTYLGISFGSQIWLNIIMDDHQFSYIPPIKLKGKKKNHYLLMQAKTCC
jgi:hypothetical protein